MTPLERTRSRYRWRTALRSRLAWPPKGKKDCGGHEWYQSAYGVWDCYHCVTRTRSNPWWKAEFQERLRQARNVKESASSSITPNGPFGI